MNQDAINALSLLTDREREVAVLTAQGFSNEEVAGRLNISVHTAKTHRYNIFNRLGIKTNVQLAVMCTLAGLVDDWRKTA